MAWHKAKRVLKSRLQERFSGPFLRTVDEVNRTFGLDDQESVLEPSSVKCYRALLKAADRCGTADWDCLIPFLRSIAADQGELMPPQHRLIPVLLSYIPLSGTGPTTLQRSLSFSSPVARPGTPAVSMSYGFYGLEGHLLLKLRLALFHDAPDAMLWEMGCSDPKRSTSRGLLCLDTKSRFRPFRAAQLFSALKRMCPPKISAIDVSPAEYHLVHLSRRCGGRFVDREQYELFRVKLRSSLRFTAQTSFGHCPIQFAEYLLRHPQPSPLAISVLLRNRVLLDADTGNALLWRSPRMLINSRGD